MHHIVMESDLMHLRHDTPYADFDSEHVFWRSDVWKDRLSRFV